MSYLNFKNKNSGFTLVEMMVAIAVFSIVMVTAMSALLNVIDANNKARAIKTAINNVSFALEGISKDMRMGTDYGCINEDGNDTNCETSGNVGVKYRSPRAYRDPISGERHFAYYRFNEGNKKIEECLEKEAGDNCAVGEFTAITSAEVDIKKVIFYVLNTDNLLKQPKMLMTLSGEAGDKEKIKTSFDLQTSVSQRIRQ